MKKILMLCGLAVLTAGCGQKGAEQVNVPLPPQFVDVMPAGDATPIPEARKLEPGNSVLLKGRIMGVRDPFVAERALFILGDEGTITPCSAMAEDHCSMPWDACCDPMDVRAAGTASIQLLDDNGKVLPLGLKGVAGLKELSKVTVAGHVAPDSTADAFVVTASAIFVEP